MGTLETLRTAPVLLLGLFAGAWVDRFRRRPILIWTDIGRALLLGLIVWVAWTDRLQIGYLYIAGFVIGALTLLFNLAYRSYLPSLVSRDYLVTANSKLSATESVAEIASPGLGGLLVQLIGPPLTLLADAISFLLSAIFIRSIGKAESPLPLDPEQKNDDNALTQTVWRDIGAGLHLVYQNDVLRSLVSASATRSFFGGFYAALYSLFVLRAVGLNATTLGILIGAGGIGALVGTLFVERISTGMGTGKTLIVTLLLTGCFSLLTPLAQGQASLWIAAVLLFTTQLVGDFFFVIYTILEISVRQSSAPDAMLGRVNASFEFVSTGVGTLGIFAGGLLGSAIGMQSALFIAAFGSILATAWLLTSPIRTLEHISP